MTFVELTQGRVAIVDAADLPLVEVYTWHTAPSGRSGLIYARSQVDDRKRLMHQLITGWAMVDHANGDGLDNRRHNLRPTSRSQNMANRRKSVSGSSQFKGVYWQKSVARWRAQIGYQGQRIYLGLYDSEEDAGRVYDAAARERFGKFAALNFPREGERGAL